LERAYAHERQRKNTLDGLGGEPSGKIAVNNVLLAFISLALERDDLSSNRHPALSIYLSMIFSENRYPLFRIML
jgi:hypothetical protein